MANVCGKSYGITAITRMHPLKTYGMNATFAAIHLSTRPPFIRGAIGTAIEGSVLILAIDLLIRLWVRLQLPWLSVWRPAADVGALLGLQGWAGAVAGAAGIVIALALVGGIIFSFWQPSWTPLGRITKIQADLIDLSFIHYARWAVIKRNEFPYFGEGQRREELNYDYLLFESNFNGDWEKYIDAFSQVIPGGMDNIWKWSVRYPRSVPITPFLDYIRNCQYDTDHYYSAYPGAATNDILGALKLETAMSELTAKAKTLSPDEFAREYAHFTVKVQNCLATTGCPPFPPDTKRGAQIPAGALVPSAVALGSAPVHAS